MKVTKKIDGDGGSEDVLDGKPLTRGQKVEIEFPDGHKESARIATQTTTRPPIIMTTEAYARIIVHGLGLKIRLAEHNLKVKRVK